MTPDDIKTESDFWAYCILYEDGIFVRSQVDGKWGSYSLAELPAVERVAKIREMMDRRMLPTRLLSDDELGLDTTHPDTKGAKE